MQAGRQWPLRQKGTVMKSSKKALLAVSAGMAALGIVLMAAGFALGGFDPEVFSMTINLDSGVVQFGGKTIDNLEDFPLLGSIANAGTVDFGNASTPAQ
jgi:hypothetical protein